MTPEEFCSLLMKNVARVQHLVGEFKAEAYAEGYSKGWDDAHQGREFEPEPDVIPEDRDDDAEVEMEL